MSKEKHEHQYKTGEGDGWFNLEQGKRVSHTVFCECGDRKDVPIGVDPESNGPLVFGLSSGERLNR